MERNRGNTALAHRDGMAPYFTQYPHTTALDRQFREFGAELRLQEIRERNESMLAATVAYE